MNSVFSHGAIVFWRTLLFLVGGIIFFFFLMPHHAAAINISTFSDTLSDSGPATSSNHTIQFTTGINIPAGGFITITPEAGFFTIPTSTFDHENVELQVNSVPRTSSSTVSSTTDGVSITSGTSGSVTITLNSTTGITSGDVIRVLLGNHTAQSTSTDTGLINPTATGTRSIAITTGGGQSGNAAPLVAIIEKVSVGPVDTTEQIPPFRFNGAPTGTVAGTVTSVELSLETDEFATCRYGTASGTPYASMLLEFDNTGSVFHSQIIGGIVVETTYTFYVRCSDDEGNINPDDYIISFTVDPAPTGEPGDGDTSGDGEGSGSGSGSSGSGSGSSSGSSSGGGSGGSSSGGSGGGGFESGNDEFPSGDAEVTINGTAFPGSEVFVTVDGALADESDRPDNGGVFQIVIDGVARGTHTFGIYAIDENDVQSSIFSTTFSVIGALGSSLSDINLMPTILVEPDPVPNIGDFVTFTGFSIPNSDITIEALSTGLGADVRTFTATSDDGGEWSANVSTAGWARGTWKVRAKSDNGTIETSFSEYTFFGVAEAADTGIGSSDLNQDGSVNITDFSILLFWWGSDGGVSSPPADINQNGNVGIEDFSIMLFNWTG